MHDIRQIRDNPAAFDAALARRGVEPVSADILALDTQRRAVATQMQEAQSRRNDASKAIGAAMGRGDKDEAERLKAEVLARITATTDYAALSGCDLIVEAVFEDPKVKAEVTAKVEAATDAVYATNTSTLPITGLAAASKRPARAFSAPV